jgi:hypothetical protein
MIPMNADIPISHTIGAHSFEGTRLCAGNQQTEHGQNHEGSSYFCFHDGNNLQ